MKKLLRRVLLSVLVFLIVAVVGLAIWGYAPDRDVEELRTKYATGSSQFVRLPNGQQVHYRDDGPSDAPVIVLLHGSNSSLHTWEGWTQQLSDSYRVISLDLQGHGLTGAHVDGDYSATGFSDTVAALLSELNIDSYFIAGNSMGGWVAWNHALAYRDQIRGLILVDASGVPEAQPEEIPIGFRLAQSAVVKPLLTVFTPRSIIAQSVRQSVGDPDQVTPAQIDRYYELLLYPGNRQATLDRGDAPRRPATPELMQRLTMPVLIMWGQQDRLIPVASARWYEREIPGSSLVIYPELGHLPMEEDPIQTVVDLRSWMASVLGNEADPAAEGEEAEVEGEEAEGEAEEASDADAEAPTTDDAAPEVPAPEVVAEPVAI